MHRSSKFYVSSAINGNKDYPLWDNNYHKIDIDVTINRWYDFEISQTSNDQGKVRITHLVISEGKNYLF